MPTPIRGLAGANRVDPRTALTNEGRDVQKDLSVMSSNNVAQPPLSPPAPSRAEAPPLSAAPLPVADPVAPTFAVAPTPEPSPQPVAPPSAPPAFVAPQPAQHRVRVRLTNGDAIEVAAHEDEAAARSEA